MKRIIMIALGVLCVCSVFAQQEGEIVLSKEAQAAEEAAEESSGFIDVVKGGGGFGIILWLALAGLSLATGSLVVDSLMNIRESKIIPKTLVSLVTEAIEE
ncbi:MAG: hypothetical protein K9M45_06665, partial [Kiritimatiellales bacterium]|nr:hypothetical protein [Kiritimatiellales bacterium]